MQKHTLGGRQVKTAEVGVQWELSVVKTVLLYEEGDNKVIFRTSTQCTGKDSVSNPGPSPVYLIRLTGPTLSVPSVDLTVDPSLPRGSLLVPQQWSSPLPTPRSSLFLVMSSLDDYLQRHSTPTCSFSYTASEIFPKDLFRYKLVQRLLTQLLSF